MIRDKKRFFRNDGGVGSVSGIGVTNSMEDTSGIDIDVNSNFLR